MEKKEFVDVSELLRKKEREILDAWIKAQVDVPALQKGLITEKQLREESVQFLRLLVKAITGGNLEDITVPEYDESNKFLADLSVSRASLGFSPTETATFIFSLKDTILKFLQEEFADSPVELNKIVIRLSLLLDKLGLVTFEAYTKGRENLIKEQNESLIALSTPVIQIWEEILILPLIGTIDSSRSKQIMENLLKSIVATKSSMVIIDITGVPAVDSEVATGLLRVMRAAKLMGTESILTGLSPQISQTIVHLEIDLSGVITKASLKDGLEMAFRKLKYKVEKMEE